MADREAVKDHLKETLKQRNIRPGEFEKLAVNKEEWREMTKTRVGHYEEDFRAKNEARRRARHRSDLASSQEVANTRCQECGRSFRSGAVLASHLRAHQS